MILWERNFGPQAGTVRNVIFKRHMFTWNLPQEVAQHIKYNPRHLPVVVNREMNDEAYYLFLSIRRIINGYRALRTYFPPSPLIRE
jgi:hypothetical protein